MRLGIAYVGNWGWIEGDLVLDFKLRSSRFLFNQTTAPNGRIGAVFNVHQFVKLGLGAFTDFSQTQQLLLPPTYNPDAIQTRPVDTKVNDVDINFGVKVLF